MQQLNIQHLIHCLNFTRGKVIDCLETPLGASSRMVHHHTPEPILAKVACELLHNQFKDVLVELLPRLKRANVVIPTQLGGRQGSRTENFQEGKCHLCYQVIPKYRISSLPFSRRASVLGVDCDWDGNAKMRLLDQTTRQSFI